jgi:hypothetical protein
MSGKADVTGLFNHLVGASKQCWRHCKAEVPRSPEIDEQREFGGLLDRQISGAPFSSLSTNIAVRRY